MVAVLCALILFAVPIARAQQPPAPANTASSPFVVVPPAATEQLRFGPRLAEFEAKDINGRTWRTEDLRDKFTVVYIWHTFQARFVDKFPRFANGSIPDVLDLFELQQFHEKVRHEKNLQVLGFCKDYDYMHAHDYMREKKYTFPVIADWVLINKLFPVRERHFPEWWLVNPEGRLSNPIESWGFGRFLFEVEKAAARN